MHPSVEGTAIVLDQIDAALNKEIILEGCHDDAVLPRKYCQVQAVYKVGCRGCDNMEYTARLCAACREEAKQMDTKSLEERIEKIRTILCQRTKATREDTRIAIQTMMAIKPKQRRLPYKRYTFLHILVNVFDLLGFVRFSFKGISISNHPFLTKRCENSSKSNALGTCFVQKGVINNHVRDFLFQNHPT